MKRSACSALILRASSQNEDEQLPYRLWLPITLGFMNQLLEMIVKALCLAFSVYVLLSVLLHFLGDVLGFPQPTGPRHV